MRSARVSPDVIGGAADSTGATAASSARGAPSAKPIRRSSSVLRQMRKLLRAKDDAVDSSSPLAGRARGRRPSLLMRIKKSLSRRSARLSEPSKSAAYLAEEAAKKTELETRKGILAVLSASADLLDADEKSLLAATMSLGGASAHIHQQSNQDIDSIADRIWGMAKMLRMSKSSMHKRALSRLLREYAELRKETEVGMAEEEQSKAAARNVQKTRKNRRRSLATGYRRYSTHAETTSASSAPVVSDDTIAEALAHLHDLEDASLLAPLLAQRGRALVSSGSHKAIMAVLKNANDDKALETYLRYASTDEEECRRRDRAQAEIDAEREERALLMENLTKTRDEMKYLLNALDAVKDDEEGGATNTALSRNSSGHEIIDQMCLLESVTKAATALATTFGTEKSEQGSTSEGASNEAARQESLASHELIDLTDPSIKSFVRIRPSTHLSVLRRLDNHRVAFDQPATQTEGKVTVDHVFEENATQSDVFRSVRPLVLCTLSGWNATILAYGQTGSGKTFTIVGGDPQVGLAGILPRALSELYAHSSERAVDGFETQIEVTFLELYRDSLVDLLSKPLAAPGDHIDDGRQAVVDVLEDSRGKPQLIYSRDRGTAANLNELKGPWKKALSAKEAMEFHHRGCRARAVGRTNLNEHSSRSHSIFMVRSTTEGPTGTTHGILTIVDLAGSENVKQSGVEGSGLSEAQANNRSLAALGNVLSLLASKKKKSSAVHVPYRSNKLTMILRDSLGGDAHALMITSVRKEEELLGQTTVSLGFAERARSIQNAASRHCKDTDTLERARHRNKKRGDLAERVATLTASGMWHRAIPHQSHLVAMTEIDFGPMHLNVARECLCLGHMFMRMGKLDRAEKAILRTIGICEIGKGEVHGENNVEIGQYCLEALHYLALVSDVMGGEKIARGLSLHEECLRRVNGDAFAAWRPRIRKALELHHEAHSSKESSEA